MERNGSGKGAAKAGKKHSASESAYEVVLASTQYIPASESGEADTIVQIPLPVLNKLLRAVGLPDLLDPCASADATEGEPQGDYAEARDHQETVVPDIQGEERVEQATWYVGTLAEVVKANDVALITCDAARELFNKKVNAKLEDLRVHFNGDLASHIGAEVVFPLNVDEDGNPWAGPPVLSNAKRLTGTISSWKGTFGFIKCDEVDVEVYLHANAAKRGKLHPEVGVRVTFSLHVSATGSKKPQASSPKPLDGGSWHTEQSSKRPKLAHDYSDGKGKGKWDGAMGYASAKGGGKWDGATKGGGKWDSATSAMEFAAMKGHFKGQLLGMMGYGGASPASWAGDAWAGDAGWNDGWGDDWPAKPVEDGKASWKSAGKGKGARNGAGKAAQDDWY